jgi:hypothetical protein
LWLEVDAAAFDIVAYMVAVFLGGEPQMPQRRKP